MRSSGAKKRELVGQALASAGSAVKIAGVVLAAARCCAKRARSRASAEPGGRGRVKRLPGAMSGSCMKAPIRGASRERSRFYGPGRALMLAGPACPKADADFRSARPPLLCPGALRRHGHARRAPVPKQYVAARRRADGRAHARGAGRRGRGSSWSLVVLAPDDGSSSARGDLRRARASRSRAAAARRARRDGGRTASPRCCSAAPAPTTGCWCTTRRAAWCAPEWIDAADRRLRRRRGRRPARAAGGRHAEARGATGRVDRRRCRATACGRRRRRRCSASACCATRSASAGAERHRRGERDRGAGPAAAAGARRRSENFKVTWPGRLRAGEARCLRTHRATTGVA